MKLTVNGKVESVDALTLRDYLAHTELVDKRIAVEFNGEIVPKSIFSKTLLKDGDVVEIVHAIGGG